MNPTANRALSQPPGRCDGREPRRRYTTAYKLQLLQETRKPGASIALVARRHNINANTVFRWRREYEAGVLAGDGPLETSEAPNEFIAVGTVDHDGVIAVLPPPEGQPEHEGPGTQRQTGDPDRIEVVLRDGIVVRMGARVPDSTLRRVLFIARELA